MSEDGNAVPVLETPSPAVPASGDGQHEAGSAAKPGSRECDKDKDQRAVALVMMMSQRLAEKAFEKWPLLKREREALDSPGQLAGYVA